MGKIKKPAVDATPHVKRAMQYARDVVSEEIPACRWVRAACQRQIDDLARKGWRWKFDAERAENVCSFIELLPHVKGRWKSKTIQLEGWQCFVLTTIFGWIDRETGFRRFRTALIVVPRKNAKTTIAAGVGLYGLVLDGEPGAEVYSAATTRDQAKISWEIAKRMVERLPDFRDEFGIEPLAHSITVESEAAFFKPLSRDADTLEGLNPHVTIIDELHAHKTREVFDVLGEASGSRRQPLKFIISTEGDNRIGVFPEQVNYLQLVLDGKHQDDSFFGIVYTIDPEDDWTSVEAWRKANPNLGVSVLEEDIAIRCRQAQKNTESQSSFLTKRLNVRVGAGEAYFNLLAWKSVCKDDSLRIEDLYGQPCHVFIDLASKSDLCAKILLFQDGATYYVFGKYYLPQRALDKGNPNYDVYRGWADSDFLTTTPGDITDYEFIERDLLEDARNFQVLECSYDPFQATQFATRMQASGVKMLECGMTVKNLSEPMKQLAAEIVAGHVKHDGDPVLEWNIGNVVARVDAKENVYPRKARDENKIDGAVALIGAMAIAMRTGIHQVSIYSDASTAVV